MRTHILDFVRRGLTASGFGPPVLAVFYLVLHSRGLLQTVTVREVCTGIFSLWALAFLAGGLNVLYQIERLPLMAAVAIHGGVLYVCYLATYLLNGWLERGVAPIVVFTCIFVLGYLAVWAVIYAVTRRNTARVNAVLKKKQLSDQ